MKQTASYLSVIQLDAEGPCFLTKSESQRCTISIDYQTYITGFSTPKGSVCIWAPSCAILIPPNYPQDCTYPRTAMLQVFSCHGNKLLGWGVMPLNPSSIKHLIEEQQRIHGPCTEELGGAPHRVTLPMFDAQFRAQRIGTFQVTLMLAHRASEHEGDASFMAAPAPLTSGSLGPRGPALGSMRGPFLTAASALRAPSSAGIVPSGSSQAEEHPPQLPAAAAMLCCACCLPQMPQQHVPEPQTTARSPTAAQQQCPIRDHDNRQATTLLGLNSASSAAHDNATGHSAGASTRGHPPFIGSSSHSGKSALSQPIYVYNRQWGFCEEEHMQPRLLPLMRFMYNTRLGRALLSGLSGERQLARLTVSKGKAMADPASAVDIAPFLATFHGHINLSEVAAPGTLQESGAISPDINPDTSVMASAYVLSTASGMQTSSQAASVGSQGKPSQEQGQPEEVLSLVTKALDSPLSPISGAREAAALARLFPTFNDFFYRALKPGSRPINAPDNPCVMVSAADCRLVAYPSVGEAAKVWVKGETFTLQSLLGGDAEYASLFEGGALLVFRLAPQDYHRFHAPCAGAVEDLVDLPGAYLTVNPVAVRERKTDPLARNRRAIARLHSPVFGHVAYIPVGATLVGSIQWSVAAGQQISKGQEMGAFAFGGSTVVVLLQAGCVALDADLVQRSQAGVETLVRVGERIGVAKDGYAGK